MELTEKSTYADLNGDGEYVTLKVTDDSMDAIRICENDILIIRRQSTVENGEIAIVVIDSENTTVKKFYKSGDIITLVPQSNNPIHQTQNYDTTQIKVIGRVVENKIDLPSEILKLENTLSLKAKESREKIEAKYNFKILTPDDDENVNRVLKRCRFEMRRSVETNDLTLVTPIGMIDENIIALYDELVKNCLL